MAKIPQVEIYQDKRNEWRWRYRARNGWVQCDGGEGYSSKSNARRAVRRVGLGMTLAPIVEVNPSYTNGDH